MLYQRIIIYLVQRELSNAESLVHCSNTLLFVRNVESAVSMILVSQSSQVQDNAYRGDLPYSSFIINNLYYTRMNFPCPV